jgi:fibronectin type 3 domain-containing protein
MLQLKTSIRTEVRKLCRYLAFLSLLIVSMLFLAACGKKAAPTLKEYEKPPAPSSLKAIHREQKIVLLWNYPKEKEIALADFTVLRSSGAEFERLALLEKSKRSFEDTVFETGTTYSYKIVARNLKGVSSSDSNMVVVKPLAVPPPPSGLSFSIQGNSLFLNWKPAEQGLFYNVYRSLEKGKYGISPVNSKPVSDGSFTDAFNINKTVYYTVRSLHAGEIRDEGAPSEELAVDPSSLVPSRLRNLTYFAAPDKVFLYWDEPEESWVTSFRIYRKTEGQDYQLTGETQIPVFVDKEPSLTSNDYRVTAAGPAKEGPWAELRGVKYTAPP